VASAACHGAAPPSPPSNQAPPPAAPAAPTDVLGYLPADSDLVVGVDVKALRRSALWREYHVKLIAALGPRFAALKEKCGFDPIETMEYATVAGRGDDTRVAVIRGWDPDQVFACIHAASPPDRAMTIDQGIITLTDRGGETHVASFVDRSTLVLDASTHPSKQRLRDLLDSGAPLRRSPAFLAMYDQLERDATVWLLVNGNGKLLDKFGSLGVRPRGVYGTVHLAAGIASTIHLRMPTADQAAGFATMMNAQMKSASAMVDHLAVTADGDVATIGLGMSADQLRTLVNTATSMMGGFGKP
jgi:hypothetical protein